MSDITAYLSLVLTIGIGAYIIHSQRKYDRLIKWAMSEEGFAGKLGHLSATVEKAALFLDPDSWISEGEEGARTLHPKLAQILDASTTVLSQKIGESIKMSAMGVLSGKARLDKGLTAAIATDVIDAKAPALKVIGGMLGINTKEYIQENPGSIMTLLQTFGPMLGGMQGGGPSSGEHPFKNYFGRR